MSITIVGIRHVRTCVDGLMFVCTTGLPAPIRGNVRAWVRAYACVDACAYGSTYVGAWVGVRGYVGAYVRGCGCVVVRACGYG